MPTFIARIQIHPKHPFTKDYKLLHAAMEERNFSRFVQRNGLMYKLPFSTYLIKGSYSKRDVLEFAKEATSNVSVPDAMIFVAETDNDFEFSGLKQIPLLAFISKKSPE